MQLEDGDITKIAIKVANVFGLVVESGIAQVKAGGRDYGSFNGSVGTLMLRTDYMNNTWMDAVSGRLTAQDNAIAALKTEVAMVNAKLTAQDALLRQMAAAMGITGSTAR
jgi:hypothetical protein